MRISIRKDLGGYAASAPALQAVEGVELDRPFVLLCGPNGSGKSALLNMIRATTGTVGDREGGFAPDAGRPADATECGEDLGKLAAFSTAAFQGTGILEDQPGVLDVHELGWRGQRTWFFSSRAETKMIDSSISADHNFLRQASLIMDGARRVSHGQFLREAWADAQDWSLDIGAWPDPYSGSVPEARKRLLDAVAPERSAEKWLFLDEPETAIDAEALATGLSMLIDLAEIGRLRVFCASHSFLFAAGLAEHPKVQVVDLGGSKPWLAMQKKALSLAMSPADLAEVAAVVAARRLEQHRSATERAERERAKEAKKAATGLSRKSKEFLLELAGSPDGRKEISRSQRFLDQTIDALERRRLIKRGGRGMHPVVEITEMGMIAADSWKPEESPEVEHPSP